MARFTVDALALATVPYGTVEADTPRAAETAAAALIRSRPDALALCPDCAARLKDLQVEHVMVEPERPTEGEVIL